MAKLKNSKYRSSSLYGSDISPIGQMGGNRLLATLSIWLRTIKNLTMEKVESDVKTMSLET